MEINAAHMRSMTAPASTSVQPRKPKGQPTGGEFAAFARAEADTVLAAEKPTRDKGPALSDLELLRTAQELARVAGIRAGLSAEDIEDVAQDTVLSVLTTQRNNGGKAVYGGLVRQASRALVSRLVDTHSRHEDSRAFTMWKRRVEEEQHTLGRHLTKAELDKLAEDIRANWHDPRHRPSVGFQHETKVVSFEGSARRLDETLGNPESFASHTVKAADQLVDDMERPVGDPKRVGKDEARRHAWNVLSEDLDTARAIESSLDSDFAQRAYRAVNSLGGAVGVASRWLDGDFDDRDEAKADAALFAPFGAITNAEKRSIAIALANRPEVANRLWKSALDFATKRAAA